MNIKKSQNYLSATGGTIDGTVIGGTTPAAGSFTTITATTSIGLDGVVTYVSEATGTATAAATFDIEVNIPAGAKILGCQQRVDVALSSGDGGTTWSAAYIDGSTVATAAGAAFTKNTKVNSFLDEHAATAIASAETDIKVTINSGNFVAGGKVTAIVYYQTLSTLASV